MISNETLLSAWCDSIGVARPKPEHSFAAPVRNWKFDFAWLDAKIALEIEGGIYQRGWHQSISGYLDDMAKYNEAALRGWLVLRATPQEVTNGEAFGFIYRAFRIRQNA